MGDATMRTVAMAAMTLALGAGPAWAQAAPGPYPAMAPLAQYRMASRDEEIATARSAAPAAISNEAEVLVLGAHGYETAAKGTNGFVCLVELSWASDLEDPEFWNPKERGPICLNPAAARSVLPTYLTRTEWVLQGVSREDMLARTRAAIAAKAITAPEAGAMGYMMSKSSYLSDLAAGHWRPHLMFFLPPTTAASWGAGVKGGAVMGGDPGVEPVTVFFVPVPRWSDGTDAADGMKM